MQLPFQAPPQEFGRVLNTLLGFPHWHIMVNKQCFDSLSFIQKFITFGLLLLLLHNRAIA